MSKKTIHFHFFCLALILTACTQNQKKTEVEPTSKANGQEYTAQEKMMHRRAVETAVWAMPMTNAWAMKLGYEAIGSEDNMVNYFSKLQDWKFRITTPNNTTPYIQFFWSIENGPVMIEIPTVEDGVALFGTLMDIWQRPLADVGPKGRDAGKGGKYLIVPAGYTGDTFGANEVLEQKTVHGYTIIRPIIANASEENLVKATAYTQKLKVYNVNDPQPTKYNDVAGKLIDGVVKFDLSLYQMINDFLQTDNIEERDAVAYGMLKGLGIEKGKEFNPTAKEKEIFEDAAKEALAYLQDTYFDNSPKAQLGNGWTVLTPSTSYQTKFTWVTENGTMELDDRGSSYFAFCTSAEKFNLTNPPTMYLLTGRDADGDKLDGGKTYKFTVPANVPARQFWSILVYDYENSAFLETNKMGVASTEKIKVNEDGTVDIFIGPNKPKGVKASNFIPTVEGKGWFPYFRFYGPEPALFKGEFKLNKIEKY